MTCFMHHFGYGCGIREHYVSVLTYLSFSLLKRGTKENKAGGILPTRMLSKIPPGHWVENALA